MMKAKELMLDFINYAFLLILVAFCITFFTVGDRFFLFGKFLKIILPFSIFGIFFLINLKIKRNIIFKLNEEMVLNEIIGYFSERDKMRDKLVIIFLPVVIMSISVIDRNIVFLDFVQALLAFLYMFFWHKILFKNQDNISKIVCLKNIDKIKDEIAIYILPVLVVGIGMFEIENNAIVDFIQGIACFIIALSWHYILFSERN